MNRSHEYSSQTILYTGLATGSSIQMDKKFNYQATNSAFDNLINIINSRETQEEVAVRLLAIHLMLSEANPKFISKKLYDELKLKVPKDLYNYVETGNPPLVTEDDTELFNNLLPLGIDGYNYEKTVQNLLTLMKGSNDNYIYELLNYEGNEHYSLKAVSSITAQRINSSDLIKLSYTTNDPGICQQTLAIYNRVCIVNYKNLKENREDAVVKYFENELANARETLKDAEDKLLEFNKRSNIINYYEQSKAVAVVKEGMEVDYKKSIAELAGIEAGTKVLEEKLEIQEVIQEKSNNILKNKKVLGNLNYKMALIQVELGASTKEEDIKTITGLKDEIDQLTAAIKKSVDELYSYQNSIEGLPISKVLPDWMNTIVAAENLKAKIKALGAQSNDFQEKYNKYAPAGANMKKLEREISISEQSYLEILHGLNSAKLKLQDSQLSSSLKTIDAPYYPLFPNPTKRTILIILAALLGGILTLGIIFIMEYFDDALKNSTRASKILNLQPLGMIPKMVLSPGNINLDSIRKRLLEIITQNILQFFGANITEKKVKTIVVFSTQKMEGKTVLAGNIAKTLKKEGKKVLLLNYEDKQAVIKQQRKLPVLNKILGYPDSRIDLDNRFLAQASNYLERDEYATYDINNAFNSAKSCQDIINQNNTSKYKPDVVIIELPALIYHNYPTELIAQSDLCILVCRSNRFWADADKCAINNLLETSASKIKFIINGVSINETESILGDLPKNRTDFRKKIKSIFKFQFFSKNQI
jgi:uncharacterized protein involved in exopolysaccharide biosynthesis